MDQHVESLETALRSAPAFLSLVRAVRELALPDAYVAAGVVRDTYWAHRHHRTHEGQADVDVVFFNPALAVEADAELEQALCALLPGVLWEVTNQAHVHRWYEKYTGVRMAPLTSTLAGIAMWPELATCIGVRERDDGSLDVAAPFGVDDLLALRWRPNPHCPDRHAFARRLLDKRVTERWPRVAIECAAITPSH